MTVETYLAAVRQRLWRRYCFHLLNAHEDRSIGPRHWYFDGYLLLAQLQDQCNRGGYSRQRIPDELLEGTKQLTLIPYY
jgi:type II secretory ATPase GspE/PulE/Tfp pilus assembly ATPase PilB-like protein